jgi:pSer/pThr/pTyr-binding forkhead associated (FHA) protein
MIELVFTKGPMTGVRFAIESDSVSIGRNGDCDIELAQSNISRVHALIKRTATGAQIIDNKSGNGTFVNGNRIKSSSLNDGDEVRIGANTICVTINAATISAADERIRNSLKPTRLDATSHFIIDDQTRGGEKVELSVDKLPIGRGEKCRLVLKDAEVSRLHATIFHRDGIFTLRDEGSANGTHCDRERIIETQLGANNVIELGNTVLTTRLAEGALHIVVSSKAQAGSKGSGSASFETLRRPSIAESADHRAAKSSLADHAGSSKKPKKPKKAASNADRQAVAEPERSLLRHSPAHFPIVRVLATVIAVAVMLLLVGRMYAAPVTSSQNTSPMMLSGCQ